MGSSLCFLDRGRECRKSCMAFKAKMDRSPGCTLLEAASFVTVYFKPRPATKHPESAQPPKVNP